MLAILNLIIKVL